MTTRKREKMIKEIIDQEFGPNLTVDEICEGIDFSQRNGVRLTDPLKKKPFFKRPLVLTLANICLILICVLSTFFIMKNDRCMADDYTKITNVLDDTELKYLEESGYRYKNHIDHLIVIEGEINLYTIVVEKDGIKHFFIKMIKYVDNDDKLKVLYEKENIIFEENSDFKYICQLTNNEISYTIEYKNSKNIVLFQLYYLN